MTCQHLRIGDGPDGGFYARCALGDAGARAAWVEVAGHGGRLAALRPLQNQLLDHCSAQLDAVWAAKAHQFEELRQGRPKAVADAGLREALASLLRAIEAHLDGWSGILDANGLPAHAVSAYIRGWAEAFLRHPGTEFTWQPPRSILRLFPAHTRVFIAPTLLSSQRASPAGEEDRSRP